MRKLLRSPEFWIAVLITVLTIGLMFPSLLSTLFKTPKRIFLYILNLISVFIAVSNDDVNLIVTFFILSGSYLVYMNIKQRKLEKKRYPPTPNDDKTENSPESKHTEGVNEDDVLVQPEEKADTLESDDPSPETISRELKRNLNLSSLQSPASSTAESISEIDLSSSEEVLEEFTFSDDDAFNDYSENPATSEESLKAEMIKHNESYKAALDFNVNGSFVKYIFRDNSKIRKIKKKIAYLEEYIPYVRSLKSDFEKLIRGFDFELLNTKNENNLVEIYGCGLIEVRKGARVTHRESSYSGSGGGGSIGFKGIRVGGGSYSGSSYSTSISYPAPDELTLIDQGKFLLTNKRVSFAGGMFTKSTDFKKIVDINNQGNQVLIAPTTGSKVWIVQFPTVPEQWFVSSLIHTAMELDEKRLDQSAISEYGDIDVHIKSSFNTKKIEIDVEIVESLIDLDRFKLLYEKFAKTYSLKV